MNQTYILKEEITPIERYKLTLHLMLKAPMIKKVLKVALIPFLLISGLSILIGDFNTDLAGLLVLPGILFFIFIVLPFILVYVLPSKKNVELVFSTSGIIRRGDNLYFDKPWSYFDSWDENKNFIFIYFKQSQTGAHIIKKSWFKSEEEMMEFLSFVDSSLS